MTSTRSWCESSSALTTKSPWPVVCGEKQRPRSCSTRKLTFQLILCRNRRSSTPQSFIFHSPLRQKPSYVGYSVKKFFTAPENQEFVYCWRKDSLFSHSKHWCLTTFWMIAKFVRARHQLLWKKPSYYLWYSDKLFFPEKEKFCWFGNGKQHFIC